jgi:uncharacterized membrane protein YqgA involved in biofilm formation
MKNSTWRKIGYSLILVCGVLMGILIGQWLLLEGIARIMSKFFQMSPEQAMLFYDDFHKAIRMFLGV